MHANQVLTNSAANYSSHCACFLITIHLPSHPQRNNLHNVASGLIRGPPEANLHHHKNAETQRWNAVVTRSSEFRWLTNFIIWKPVLLTRRCNANQKFTASLEPNFDFTGWLLNYPSYTTSRAADHLLESRPTTSQHGRLPINDVTGQCSGIQAPPTACFSISSRREV